MVMAAKFALSWALYSITKKMKTGDHFCRWAIVDPFRKKFSVSITCNDPCQISKYAFPEESRSREVLLEPCWWRQNLRIYIMKNIRLDMIYMTLIKVVLRLLSYPMGSCISCTCPCLCDILWSVCKVLNACRVWHAPVHTLSPMA